MPYDAIVPEDRWETESMEEERLEWEREREMGWRERVAASRRRRPRIVEHFGPVAVPPPMPMPPPMLMPMSPRMVPMHRYQDVDYSVYDAPSVYQIGNWKFPADTMGEPCHHLQQTGYCENEGNEFYVQDLQYSAPPALPCYTEYRFVPALHWKSHMRMKKIFAQEELIHLEELEDAAKKQREAACARGKPPGRGRGRGHAAARPGYRPAGGRDFNGLVEPYELEGEFDEGGLVGSMGAMTVHGGGHGGFPAGKGRGGMAGRGRGGARPPGAGGPAMGTGHQGPAPNAPSGGFPETFDDNGGGDEPPIYEEFDTAPNTAAPKAAARGGRRRGKGKSVWD